MHNNFLVWIINENVVLHDVFPEIAMIPGAAEAATGVTDVRGEEEEVEDGMMTMRRFATTTAGSPLRRMIGPHHWQRTRGWRSSCSGQATRALTLTNMRTFRSMPRAKMCPATLTL